MKKVGIYFLVYYVLGLLLISVFQVIRFPLSFEISSRIIIQNFSTPTFYGLALIWPLYLGSYLYMFITGNID